MSTHPNWPPANQTPAVELRVLDPGGDHLSFTWQIRNGHGHLLASGQVAGAPPQLGGWRYHALADAAHAAITALQDLEATQPPASPAGHGAASTRGARTCDFCAAAPAAWRYPIRGGHLAPVLVGEVLVIVPGGDWYACPPCHHLVQAGRWDALSAKAHLPHQQGAALWATFQAARAGNPTPLHPHRPHGQDGSPGR
jgi:hypothetical protein